MKIPPLEDRDRAWAEELVRENFSSSRVVSRSVLHQTERLPGIVAEDGTTPIGHFNIGLRTMNVGIAIKDEIEYE